MFTGIIQAVGIIVYKKNIKNGIIVTIKAKDLDIHSKNVGASIAVNGVCLTTTKIEKDSFSADVSKETINCTNFKNLNIGDKVNLEMALSINQGLDGHIVTGHIDAIGRIISSKKDGESIRYDIQAPQNLIKYIARKGSITIDGVSLTVNKVKNDVFSINIIPYTLNNTIFHLLNINDKVNIEVDIIARYLEKLIACNSDKGINIQFLKQNGYL